jgi:hypothetical protein
MSNSLKKSILILTLAIVYFFLFHDAYWGINVLLYSLVLISATYFLSPEEWSSPSVKVSALGTVLSAIAIVWQHSALAFWAHAISFLLFIGFVQQRELRFFWYALLLGLRNIFAAPFDLVKHFAQSMISMTRLNFSIRWLSIIALPMLLAVVFFTLYHQANSPFTSLVLNIWESTFLAFFRNFSFYNLFFLLVGLFLATSALSSSAFAKTLAGKEDLSDIKRVRKANGFASMLALKTEYQTAIMSFGMLNALLLMVNFFDLPLFWLDYSSKSYVELKSFVHQGTYILIVSILLAMAIILYFFRKNLNFFPENKMLKALAIAWCAQNAWLVFTVGFRNMQYIWHTGLAYKRIGVIFFLTLTIFGLWTMAKKIKEKKSIPLLFHWNAWAAYALLISSSFINWDIVITKYNLNHPSKEPLDLDFLIYDVSDKNLYLLYGHQKEIAQELGISTKEVEEKMTYEKVRFLRKQKRKDWRAWNWADTRNANYFNKK